MFENRTNSRVSGLVAVVLLAAPVGCPSNSNPTPQSRPPAATIPVEKPSQQQPQIIPYSVSVDYTAHGGISVDGLQPVDYTGLVTLYGATQPDANGRYLNIGTFPVSALEAAVVNAAQEGKLPEKKPEEDDATYFSRMLVLVSKGLINQIQAGDPNAIVLSPRVIEQGLNKDVFQQGSSIYDLVIPEGGITNVSLQYRLIAPAVNGRDGKLSPKTGATIEVYLRKATDLGNDIVVYSNPGPAATFTITNPGGSDTPTPVKLSDLPAGKYRFILIRIDDPNHISNLLVQSITVQGTQYATSPTTSTEKPRVR